MIAIIGAGPVGCFLGYLLAKQGKEVHIYEEHKEIGKPVQCTGIVTKDIEKIISLKDKFIINKINKVNIFSKNNNLELPIEDIVLDREKFDKHIADLAKKYGAKIHLSHRFLGIEGKNIVIEKINDKPTKQKKTSKLILKPEFLIGADGPLSSVAKAASLDTKNKDHNGSKDHKDYTESFMGIQARVKGKYDNSAYEVYFGSICPGFFTWILPESKKVARIGLASKDKKNAKILFRKFLKNRSINQKDILDIQAGLIPLYNRHKIIYKDNIFLVGDAASHVKATTGGGLVPGLNAAKKLAESIIKDKGKSYKKKISGINRELNIHLRIRHVLDNFSDKDYNTLLKRLNNKKIKDSFKMYSRDNPKKLILKILLEEPSLLFYTTKFINQIKFTFR